jgi:hypothetical protein
MSTTRRAAPMAGYSSRGAFAAAAQPPGIVARRYSATRSVASCEESTSQRPSHARMRKGVQAQARPQDVEGATTCVTSGFERTRSAWKRGAPASPAPAAPAAPAAPTAAGGGVFSGGKPQSYASIRAPF